MNPPLPVLWFRAVGDVVTTPDQLALAVSGISGIVGFLVLPMFGAWLRILLRWLDADEASLNAPPRLRGTAIARALGLSFLVGFFLVALARAASELREIRIEAPVFGGIVWGVVVGGVLWAVYAIGVNTLRGDLGGNRTQGRV